MEAVKGILGLIGFYLCIFGLSWLASSKGDSVAVLAFVLGLVSLFLVDKAWRSLKEHRQKETLAKQPCKHGVPGGRSRSLCGTCNSERQEEAARWEQERERRQRQERIRQDANSLRRNELKRLAQARAGRLDFLLSGTALDYEYVGKKVIELVDGNRLGQMMVKAFPGSSAPEEYSMMCIQCGAKVIFDLSKGEERKPCPNGHPIQNDLSSDLLSLKLISGKLYCDKCGSEMRVVRGWRGEFWGCTRYPNCRYTRPIARSG